MHAAIHAGVWMTPINWHLTEPEIEYVVRDSTARVLFADDHHEETAARCDPGTRLRVGDELDRALAGASDAPMDPEGPPGGSMIYTSGTTGRPKGVKRKQARTLREALDTLRSAAVPIGLDGDGAHLVTGPCYHAAPLMFAVYDQMSGAPWW